jgi:general secretion pathway protein G
MAQRKPFPAFRALLAIVALLIAALGFLQYKTSVLSAEEATVRSQLFVMRDALDNYVTDKGTCPESLSQLVAGKYIRAIPVDPSTKSATTWRYTQARTGDRFLCDVKTTSPKVARDGRRYADW